MVGRKSCGAGESIRLVDNSTRLVHVQAQLPSQLVDSGESLNVAEPRQKVNLQGLAV
jgi:hypothetical protein